MLLLADVSWVYAICKVLWLFCLQAGGILYLKMNDRFLINGAMVDNLLHSVAIAFLRIARVVCVFSFFLGLFSFLGGQRALELNGLANCCWCLELECTDLN